MSLSTLQLRKSKLLLHTGEYPQGHTSIKPCCFWSPSSIHLCPPSGTGYGSIWPASAGTTQNGNSWLIMLSSFQLECTSHVSHFFPFLLEPVTGKEEQCALVQLNPRPVGDTRPWWHVALGHSPEHGCLEVEQEQRWKSQI